MRLRAFMKRVARRGEGEGARAAGVGMELPLTTVDHGSFSHGFCSSCGWEGPGRRARSVAAQDVQLHELAGCGAGSVPRADAGAHV